MDEDTSSDYSFPKPTPRRSIKNLLQHENYAYDASSPTLNYDVKRYPLNSATLNMPTPRKPRRIISSTLKRETEIRINASHTSSTSSVRQLLFDPTTANHVSKRMYYDSPFINKRESSEQRSITSKIPRPNAPPPPPPPLIGFSKLEGVSTLPQPRIIKNMGSFDYLGFESYEYRKKENNHNINHVINIPNRKYLLASSSLDSTVSNEVISPSKGLSAKRLIEVTVKKSSICKRIFDCIKNRMLAFEKPIMPTRKFISMWIYIFSVIIFLSCITFIVSFQIHVHDFYKKSINFKISNSTESIVANNDENYALIASTQLINRTVLFCNSPYLSYQVNNLIVLPFSLLLTLIFSFFSKRDSLCVNQCSGRPGIPASINPFLKRNRFLNAALFCILANEVFKML